MRPGPLASRVYPDQLEAGSQILTAESPSEKLDCFKQSSFTLRSERRACGQKRYWLNIALGRDLVSGSVDVLGTQLEEVRQ
jgi:hypothetical protein